MSLTHTTTGEDNALDALTIVKNTVERLDNLVTERDERIKELEDELLEARQRIDQLENP